MSWKKSLFSIFQVLGLLVNTLAADGKYPVLNRDNLTMPIQMQLSQKQKRFSQFFVQFLNYRLNFIDFENNDDTHRFFVSEITTSKNVSRQMSKKFQFRGSFDNQHGKRAKTLLKSASQHFHLIH